MLRSLVIAAALLPFVASAATLQSDHYRRLNIELVDAQVVPGYGRLADSAAALHARAARYCSDEASLDEVREAWGTAFDAWQGVQHLRFGPIELFMRGMRMQFWPDPRNSVGGTLDEVLAKAGPALLEEGGFDELTVPAQGFPAIEYLIHGDALTPGGYACGLLRTIAGGIADMAADTLETWVGGDKSWREGIAHAGDGKLHYQNDQEVTQDFFKAMHGALELVAEHKLVRPLGASLETAKPKLAESWRSGRSLDNIRVNLAAAEAMYLGRVEDGGFSRVVREVAGDAKLDDLLRRAFKQTRGTADSIEMPLSRAIVDPTERAKLAKLAREASALKALLAQRLTAALGIPLGFNSMDGD
ncbi:MAG: imelysin family protein [Azoarcus sp.]|nr:imelysin family protein [Azoarcus sp.]